MLFGLLALCFTGCGLSDYQSRMDAQRARLQKFDDANLLLGDPIEIPTLPGKGGELLPAWPFDLYLRLPKGFVPDKKVYGTNFPCYGYAGPDPAYHLFVAAASLIDKDAKERYGECSAARFRDLVRLAIDDYYFKKYPNDLRFNTYKLKLFLPVDKVTYNPFEADLITPYSDVIEKIPYLMTSFKDTENKKQDKHLEFRVYIHEQPGKVIEEAGKQKKLPGKQIAIVTQSPVSGPNEQFERSIQSTLGTLDLGPEVVSKRAQYKRLKGS